jgi:hypothetical protein
MQPKYPDTPSSRHSLCLQKLPSKPPSCAHPQVIADLLHHWLICVFF